MSEWISNQVTTGPRLAEGCPWSTWMPPNLAWCEERLCEWVVTPANAWSNLAYIFVAWWIAKEWKHRKDPGVLKLYAPAALLVGFASFVYHASYTFFFQVFDFAGMYSFIFLPLMTQFWTLGWVKESQILPRYIGAVLFFTVLTVAFYFLSIPLQLIMVFLILSVIGLEFLRRSKLRKANLTWRSADFYVAFVLLFGGATLSALDLSGKFCDPANHWLQGHSLWHLCTGAALIFVYRHFRTQAPLEDQ
jgi:hypothetical protein